MRHIYLLPSWLVRPFRWQGSYIPLLPTQLVDFLQSPVPFIAGVAATPANLDEASAIYEYRQDGRAVVTSCSSLTCHQCEMVACMVAVISLSLIMWCNLVATCIRHAYGMHMACIWHAHGLIELLLLEAHVHVYLSHDGVRVPHGMPRLPNYNKAPLLTDHISSCLRVAANVHA